MKKSTVLSLTTAAVILAAYVPNEVILADTPSSEDSLKISDKETVIDKQNENEEKLEDIMALIEKQDCDHAYILATYTAMLEFRDILAQRHAVGKEMN